MPVKLKCLLTCAESNNELGEGALIKVNADVDKVNYFLFFHIW